MARDSPAFGSVWQRRALLSVVIAVYLALGAAYAFQTPKWEAPDEPAHYNYIKTLVEEGRLPVLKMGDYPHEYLEEIKAAQFPEHMSIDSIRYESHQPPLYYLLVAPLYKATASLSLDMRVRILRLFSVLLGALLLPITYRTLREAFPAGELLALAGTAFTATVPMHIALSAAVSNDTLAELILALIYMLLMRSQRSPLTERGSAILGLLIGLGLLTKTTTYISIPLTLVALTMPHLAGLSRSRRQLLQSLAIIFGLALLVAGGWFIRNALVYGDWDLFGWKRHDLVVVGQPRTRSFGLEAVRYFLFVSFRSFWAQFGWMGILVDSRIYSLLWLLTGCAGLGLAIFISRIVTRRRVLTAQEISSLGILGLAFILILGQDIWYNLKFIQAQGRYLFPAIGPIGLFFVLGLGELVGERYRKPAFLALYLGLLALDVICLQVFIAPYFR